MIIGFDEDYWIFPHLKYMREFAMEWSRKAIVQGSLAQLPWYHHLALLDAEAWRDRHGHWRDTAKRQAGSHDFVLDFPLNAPYS
jgi:hypothetical protein